MYPFYGFAKADMKVKGAFPEPTMDGYVDVSEAYLIKPIPNAKKANININFIEKQFMLQEELMIMVTIGLI